MNFMPPIAQAFSRAIENPFGPASEIEALMSESNLHTSTVGTQIPVRHCLKKHALIVERERRAEAFDEPRTG
jgi:hypothetical protein